MNDTLDKFINAALWACAGIGFTSACIAAIIFFGGVA